jgi:hypothetical protein
VFSTYPITRAIYKTKNQRDRMSAIDQSQMPRAQPGREVVPKPVVGKKGYPFWLGGKSSQVGFDRSLASHAA